MFISLYARYFDRVRAIYQKVVRVDDAGVVSLFVELFPEVFEQLEPDVALQRTPFCEDTAAHGYARTKNTPSRGLSCARRVLPGTTLARQPR